MLKLKHQYFGHLIRRTDSLKKTLIVGKIEGKKRRGQQRMRWLGSITELTDMNLGKLWKVVRDKETCSVVVHGVAKSWIQLSGFTYFTYLLMHICVCKYIHFLKLVF